MHTPQKVTKPLIVEFHAWISLGLSRDTANGYAATLIKYCLGKSIDTINRKEFFVELGAELSRRQLTTATVARHTFAVKKFLVFLNEKYELPIINLAVIRCRKSPRPNPTYLERREIEAIRRVPAHTIMEIRDRALFEFLLDSGCRISEALGIAWRNIDFQKGEVEVLGKGNKKRTVFLNGSKTWLETYLAQRGSDSTPLFLSQYRHRALNRENAAVAIRNLGYKAGVSQRVHPHLMRHTFGTYLIWAGVDPRTVQEMMGHEDLETTLKYYAAVTQERMKQAHVDLGNFITSGEVAPVRETNVSRPIYQLP